VSFEFSQRTQGTLAWRYAIAVVAVIVATGMRFVFHEVVTVYAPYLPYTLAVTVAALIGGRGPGLAAAALSGFMAEWFFLRPEHALASESPAAVWALALFVASVALIAWLVGSLRESLAARARVEEALRRQAQLIDLSHDAVVTMDCNRHILSWNKGAVELYGWAEREVSGNVLHTLLRTECPTPLEEVNEALQREGRWEGEMTQIARDGRCRVVDSRQVLLPAGNRLPECILTINRDITARKQSDEALRQSEEQFRTLANTIPQLCGIAEPDGRFVWSNRRWYEYTGLTAEQTRGWGWVSAVDREASAAALEVWRYALEAGKPFESVFAVRGVDGVVRPFLALANPVRDRDSKVVQWFGTMTDISEQRKTEDALRKAHSEELARAAELQAMMDAVPVAMFIARDPECRSVLGNRSAYQLLREMPGSNLSISARECDEAKVRRMTKDGREIPFQELPLQKAATTGQSIYGIELEAAFPDGGRANIIANAVPLLDAQGRPRGAIGTLVDITERKQTEERLRQAQKLESIGLLAGGIAHDFNNLLTVIMGNADVARTQCPGCKPVRQILASSERAAELTRQLLAYAGKGQFIAETFNLTDLVSRCKELLASSVPRGVQLRFNLSPEDVVIRADPSQIERVLVNLVVNAGEAIPPQTDGCIEVGTGIRDVTPEAARAHAPLYDAQPGRFVGLEVSDNGSGMEEATLTRLFSPFFSTKFTGRGLGLAAVQGIVRSCGGFIDVQSSPGAGSKFQVFLPAAVKKPAAVSSESGTSEGSRGQGSNPKAILVVDDEELVRELACAALRSAGYEVLAAADGRAALEILAGAGVPPAAVLLDRSMPGMNGDELVPILNRTYPSLRIVLTSGYPEADVRDAFLPGSVAGFLQKPYTVAALIEKVEETLRGGDGPTEKVKAAA
jgi:PAS domain S-box-containing protein